MNIIKCVLFWKCYRLKSDVWHKYPVYIWGMIISKQFFFFSCLTDEQLSSCRERRLPFLLAAQQERLLLTEQIVAGCWPEASARLGIPKIDWNGSLKEAWSGLKKEKWILCLFFFSNIREKFLRVGTKQVISGWFGFYFDKEEEEKEEKNPT